MNVMGYIIRCFSNNYRLFQITRRVPHSIIEERLKLAYLLELQISYNFLREIPEAMGSMPNLKILSLEHNCLGLATNWNWLTSPIIRANLTTLNLAYNEVCILHWVHKTLRNIILWLMHVIYMSVYQCWVFMWKKRMSVNLPRTVLSLYVDFFTFESVECMSATGLLVLV